MPTTVIPNLKDEARRLARETLSASASFKAMPMEEQRTIYTDLVNENINKLSRRYNLVQPMENEGANMGYDGYDPGFEGSVDAFEDLVDSVDFPKFVADLLKAVFDANITVMKKQTDDYIRLMREATKSVADFVKKVKDDDTFAYLAEGQDSQFNLGMETGADGSQKLTLTNPEGKPVNMEDNQVKAKIMEAKIAMAKEHRAALREVILMGVTRLVVEKGEIEAACEFRIKSNRLSNTSHVDQTTTHSNRQGSASISLPFLGRIGGSASVSSTRIEINTANKKADDELFGQLKGKVNIQFKTDYFKLDNFAQMYSNGGTAALQPNAPQQGTAAAPAR